MAQTIQVQPYLQDAGPTRMTIMWETTSGTQSTVDYDTTTALGSSVNGSSFISSGTARVHTVTLDGLSPNTLYYYRATTGPAVSAIHRFRTPALQGAEARTVIVAMSDMQKDGGYPNKFWQVVHNGVIQLVNDSMGLELCDELSMVILAGDLVADGTDYGSWKTDFFDPAADLIADVPVYPAIGNHEQNSPNYFNYFQLPNNGTPGFGEHWWYKDHGNVRIIGLNTNPAYQQQAQLDWLDSVLADATTDPDIDFVFANFHHPFHSELWIAGNTDYTGEVIGRMENFSTATGKPSAHFFGHTHAYSRGASRDHVHLMVNVATAAGHIDHWGEYAQMDYPEYSISQDEYGFVLIEVEAGDDPRFTLKRYSLGDEVVTKNNALEDMLTIHRYGNAPVQPSGFYPTGGMTVSPDCVVLKGTPFADADGGPHRDSQWQVGTSCTDWTNPVVDSWRQYQNWYYETDLQAGDDLTDERVTTLLPGTSYCWRVRYRDEDMKWSAWSDPGSFTTGPSAAGPNLLANPGAENGTTAWTTTAGVIESLAAGECDGASPHAGTYYFAVGALCTENAFARAEQAIDVGAQAAAIDAGGMAVSFGGWLRDWNGDDRPDMFLAFRDADGTVLDTTSTVSNQTGTWTLLQQTVPLPPGTRSITAVLTGTRFGGLDNDSYFDDLFVRLLTDMQCSEPYVRPQVTVMLEGPYDQQTGLMHDSLRVQGLLPGMEPFTALGFIQMGEGGGEHLDTAAFSNTGPDAVVDWILLELRTGTTAASTVATRSCLLLRNGRVVGMDGVSPPQITALPGNYYLVVRHRNHLGVMTALPVDLSDGTAVVDLSDPAFPTYGTDARKVIGSKALLWAGNVAADHVIRYTGAANDRDPIMAAIGGLIPTATVTGYRSEDVNMDGVAKYAGANNDRDPILLNINSAMPTSIRLEQVP